MFSRAANSERKRAHLLLHDSHQEKVQRLLIAMVQGSYVDPHYHELPHQWELFVVLQGEVRVSLYDKDGPVVSVRDYGPTQTVAIMELEPGEIHSVECISDCALLLEVKEGPFDPTFAKAFIQ
nr:WbuC family cupin fold metalloprotein [Yersinia ruckeri]